MSNKQTEYSIQQLKNLSADVTVSPPVPREGIMGKADDGSYYNLSVDQAGAVKQSEWCLNNYTETSPAYLGQEKTDGTWRVKKVDTSTGAITYATVSNNPSVTTYSDAWTNKATLTYGTAGTL